MSWLSSYMLVAVVATLLITANWMVVPCASLQCATLAEVSSVGLTNLGPTIAQRVLIGDSPITISTVSLPLSSTASGVVEAQIRNDNGAVVEAPSDVVSSYYVGQAETLPNTTTSTYSFVFSNSMPALAANTYYWIVFTSPAAIQVQWRTGSVQTTTSSINIDASAAYLATANFSADQVSSDWTLFTAGTVTLAITISGCFQVEASPSTTPTSSQSPGTSPSSTPTNAQVNPSSTPLLSPTSTATASLTPRVSRTATPTSTPTPVPTSQSSLTPLASASPSPVVLIPITANVTSSFDSTQAALNLTAPASTNGTSGVTQPGVTVVSQFSEVQLGNRALPPPLQELTVSNDTSTNTTTYTYASQLENTTSVEQAFTFFDRKTSANFSGLTFDISASSVKWSIHLISSGANSTAGGVTLNYRLTALLVVNSSMSSGSTSGAVASRGQVVVKRETPRANMTTYLVPLFVSTSATTSTTTTTAAQVELFDVALIDGSHFAPIGHSIVRTADNETAEYVVELVLPGFNESLFYDPTIGLGVLLGRNDQDGGSSSESNVGLIVGVAVAIPVAVALVLVVIGAALVIGWRQRQLARRNAGSINFGSQDDDRNDQL